MVTATLSPSTLAGVPARVHDMRRRLNLPRYARGSGVAGGGCALGQNPQNLYLPPGLVTRWHLTICTSEGEYISTHSFTSMGFPKQIREIETLLPRAPL